MDPAGRSITISGSSLIPAGHRSAGNEDAGNISAASLQERIFGKVDATLSPSSYVLQIIKHIAETCLPRAIKTIARTYDPTIDLKKVDKLYLNTACTNSADLVLSLLLGRELSKQKISFFSQSSFFKLRVPQIDRTPQKPWSYKVGMLFDGIVINSINKQYPNFEELPEDQQEQIIDDFLQAIVNIFTSYLGKRISNVSDFFQLSKEEKILKVKKILKTLPLDFNELVFKQLEDEIAANEANTTASNSFVYAIAIIKNTVGDKKPPQNPLANNDAVEDFIYYDHIFLIEQSCTPTGEIHYRRYQSMAGKATLLQDIDSHLDVWNKEQLDTFFSKLKDDYLIKNFHLRSRAPFDYNQKKFPAISFNDEKNVLVGASLRYFCMPFDPQNVLNNVADFLNCDPKLQAHFTKS